MTDDVWFLFGALAVLVPEFLLAVVLLRREKRR